VEEHINKNLVPPGVTAADRSAVTADLLDAVRVAYPGDVEAIG